MKSEAVTSAVLSAQLILTYARDLEKSRSDVRAFETDAEAIAALLGRSHEEDLDLVALVRGVVDERQALREGVVLLAHDFREGEVSARLNALLRRSETIRKKSSTPRSVEIARGRGQLVDVVDERADKVNGHGPGGAG